MIGQARELAKGHVFALDWSGPWKRVVAVRRGRLAVEVQVQGGERLTLPADQGVRFEPNPGAARARPGA